MGKKDSRENRRSHTILTDDTDVGSVYNITENVKELKKLYEMSNCLDKDLSDMLMFYGHQGLSPKEIALICDVPKKTMDNIFSKGEQDYELGKKSIEADYYRAYHMGLKWFEIEASKSAVRKDPMKMLAVINPEKYSDKVTDKYELPKIEFNFGDKTISVNTSVEDNTESEEDVDD